MLKRVHTKMTFFCSLVIGSILLVMTLFCLIISERGIRSKNYTDFQTNSSSLLTYIDNQSLLSHTWLSQMESNYQMIIDIRDGETPLLYGNLHSHDAYSALLELARETARQQYHLSTKNLSSSHVLLQQQTFRVYDTAKEEYYATVAFLPKGEGYLDIALLSPAKLPGNQITRQRVLFSVGALISWIILTVLTWFFIRRILQPVEENRKKQTQFIASASHELRSPLTVMLSSLSAARIASPDEQIHFFNSIESEGTRMAHLIQDMLMLANSDNHSWVMHPSSVELDTLLLDTYEKYESVAKEKGLHLKVSLPDSPLPACLCDRERIAQILSILIDNAFAYTPCGGKVELALSSTQKNCILTVSDNGPGIPDEDKSKIFDRFYRADPAHHDKEHFGLGLCIAKEIVFLHKGTIRVEDQPGGGASFIVTLPRT